MTYVSLSSSTRITPDTPVVRTIGVAELRAAMRAGIEDFMATPTHAIFLAVIYPVIGLVITRMTMGEDLLPIVYPLIAGFALLGPFAALGLYELSRRRERGEDIFWTHVFDVRHSPSLGAILALGAVQMLLFVAWIATAHAIYAGLFGSVRPHSIRELIDLTLTTPAGWALIVLGNGIGFVFAVVALTLSVVSFPLRLDRPVDAATAVSTSIRAVRDNPGPMALWGLMVAVLLAVATLPFFIGLPIVLPILGHATWHLYRAVIVAPGRSI